MTMPVTACQAHEVGGKTLKEVFSDRKVRKLANAACMGDHKAIKFQIKKGTDVNSTGYMGVTPLFWALSCENYDGIDALLQHGADPNHITERGRTPFTASATYDDPHFLKLMLKRGGNVNAVFGSTEETILMAAFRSGIDHNEWSKYYMLLNAGANINYVTKDRSYTLARFSSALFRRQCKTLELIERGYSVNLDDLLGYVEMFAPLPESPDAKCQEPLKAAINARIAEQKK